MATYFYTRAAGRGLVRQLARRLRLRCVDATRRPKPRDVRLICWGNSVRPDWFNNTMRWVMNTPESVSVMAHKIRTFEALNRADVPCLEWTTDHAVATGWLQADNSVYIRNVLTGHSAEGLVYLEQGPGVVVPRAPLYTRNYGTPFKEYRLHVVGRTVIDMTMKQRMTDDTIRERGEEVPDERQRLQVRTYGNGWVFTRNNILDDPSIRTLAVNAIQAVGADFGAVDIVAKWNRNRTECTDVRVVEINSAPALRSTTTLAAYVNAFGRL